MAGFVIAGAFLFWWPCMAENHQSQPHTEDNKTAQGQESIPPTHAVVDPSLSAPKEAKPIPASSKEDSPEKSLPPWERPEWVIVYVTAAYSLIAGCTLFVIWRQASTMADQVQMIKDKERARLVIEFPSAAPKALFAVEDAGTGQLDRVLDVHIRVTNAGETRAFAVSATGDFSVGTADMSITKLVGTKLSIPDVIRVDIPEVVRIEPVAGIALIASEDWDAILGGDKCLHIFGNIAYEDVFGKRCEDTPFHFCWRVIQRGDGMGDAEAKWEKLGY